jgi:hypothetical protein
MDWEEGVQNTVSAAPYVGDILTAMFAKAQAVVVLLTGDDVARFGSRFLETRDGTEERELTPQARPNVAPAREPHMAYGRRSIQPKCKRLL